MTTPQSQWQKLLSADRLSPKPAQTIEQAQTNATQKELGRTDFHTDYDRVVFCNAFRRLGRKTQVHAFAKSDHTHNRLTHSVEVASVGRSLGNQVGQALQVRHLLPHGVHFSDIGTIVQVACLAHDLGNPPFGHTGEDALREWFVAHPQFLQGLSPAEQSDIGTYEGNAQSLRIATCLEMYAHKGGMRLTAASLGTLIKYPWTSTHAKNGKFNIYQSELAIAERLFATLGIDGTNGKWTRHPLSYLMEAADDICYAFLDLEDALALGLIERQDFYAVLAPFANPDYPNSKIEALRGKAIGQAIKDAVHSFMAHHNTLLAGEFEGDLLSQSASHEIICHAKELAADKIYRHQSKLPTQIASFACLHRLLDLFVPAIYAKICQNTLTKQQVLVLHLLDVPIKDDDSLYQGYQKALDFIGGMTDNYAGQLVHELSGVNMGR